MKLETEMEWCSHKPHLEPPEAEEARNTFFPRAFGGYVTADTLVLNFCSPSYERINLCCFNATKFMVNWECSPGNWIRWPSLKPLFSVWFHVLLSSGSSGSISLEEELHISSWEVPWVIYLAVETWERGSYINYTNCSFPLPCKGLVPPSSEASGMRGRVGL